MLTGDPPFTGSTAQAIVAKVMTERPVPPSRMRDTVPETVEDAVLTALAKLPADRYATAAEFAAALADTGTTSRRTTAMMARAAPRGTERFLWPVAAAAMLAGGLLVGRWLAPAPPSGRLVRATLQLTDSTAIRPVSDLRLAIAPDGDRVAYVGTDGDDAILWVRDLDAVQPRKLEGTNGT